MAVSLTTDIQQRAKASGPARLMGTGVSDSAPFPWRELTASEGQEVIGGGGSQFYTTGDLNIRLAGNRTISPGPVTADVSSDTSTTWYKKLIRVNNTAGAVTITFPDAATATSNFPSGHFCDIQVASPLFGVSVTVAVADQLRTQNGQNGWDTTLDTVFLGLSTFVSDELTVQVYRVGSQWMIDGPVRAFLSADLTFEWQWLDNINGNGNFLYNHGLGLFPVLINTSHNVNPLHRGRIVPLSNVAGWTLTIVAATPAGDYYYKDTGGAGGTLVGGSTVTLYTMNSAGTGLTGVTSPSLAVLPNGRVWFRIEENAGTAPVGVAGGDLDVPAVFTDPVTFKDFVTVTSVRPTFRDIGSGSTIIATDSGKTLFATSTGTATVSAASTLAPVAGGAFICTVINESGGTYNLDGPGASNVAMAANEGATIVCKNGDADVRVYKSLGVVVS